MSALVILIINSAFILIGIKRGLRYLRYFQQEDYNAQRFVAWYKNFNAFDKRLSLVLLAYALCSSLCCTSACAVSKIICALVYAAILAIVIYTEEDPLRHGKILLNMTERASRIFQLSLSIYFALVILSSAVLYYVSQLQLTTCSSSTNTIFIFLQLLWIQSLPFIFPLANWLLVPLEKSIQEGFIDEAKQIWQEVNPYTIGITGSYGKTSTKHILGELMNITFAPTFWPPKSYNSIMGITKEIRARLRRSHKYAIIEMGAYGIGSIAKLCKFTPPRAAIITAVGIMHLERFGSPENVYKAKSELPQALPKDGLLVVNADNLGARKMAAEYRTGNVVLYALDAKNLENSFEDKTCHLEVLHIKNEKTYFQIHWQGKSYPSHTSMLGAPALSNIAASFATCVALGANPRFVAAAIPNLTPIDNRLVLKKDRGISYLQDAYNSNPAGFIAALDVLKLLEAKRRILLTPGMIELGDQQFERNQDVAAYAAKICDQVIIVGNTNREALTKGLELGGFAQSNITFAEHRAAAFSFLHEHQQEGDLVLIENDLTDLYENKVSF